MPKAAAIKIRRALERDAAEITKLMIEFKLLSQRKSPIYDKLKPNAAALIADKVLAAITGEDSAIYVAEAPDGGSLTGLVFCEMWPNLAIYDIEEIGYIPELFVTETERGKGVGTKLLKAAEKHFKERGVRDLRIETIAHYETNQAYYEARGFTPFLIELRKTLS